MHGAWARRSRWTGARGWGDAGGPPGAAAVRRRCWPAGTREAHGHGPDRPGGLDRPSAADRPGSVARPDRVDPGLTQRRATRPADGSSTPPGRPARARMRSDGHDPAGRRPPRDILRIARDVLEHAGFTVLTASDGRGGAAPGRDRGGPDLLVLDLGLPDIDGLDVARSCAGPPTCRSSCSPPGRTRPTRSSAWSWARTTT